MKEYSVLIMYSKELDRDVKVYVSLPKSYFETDKYYPVLYMHDGQILFNDLEDYNGKSWGIMESYKNNPNLPELILVGIASGDTRNDELLPVSIDNNNGKFIGGKANDYMDFIVNKLKPIINKKYRTLKSSENTGILGVSLGGVCSTYAATNYSEHFTIFGCVSNAYIPIRKDMIGIIKKSDLSRVKKMYLDVGTKESENEKGRIAYLESNKEVFDVLKEKLGSERIKFEVINDAQHIVADWEKRFPNIISYLFKG
ncbi:alpha/beta hydrolase-fold protein [Mycoplasmatota bacterium zrk1]